MTLYRKGLQNCRPSNFAVKKKLAENPSFIKLHIEIGGPGSIPGQDRLLGAVGLQPLELRRLIALFWKPLTLTILGLEAQGRGSTFRVHHALLKIAILL